ncbi:hypothetical protein Avbf_06249, partial [Armadillidium vulgare]
KIMSKCKNYLFVLRKDNTNISFLSYTSIYSSYFHLFLKMFREELEHSHKAYLKRFMQREINAAQLLMHHPHNNIIRIYNITRMHNRWLLFFMSLSRSNLFSWVTENRPRGMKEYEARCIFRDLKLENILVHKETVDKDGHIHLEIRLGDLGFCSQGKRREVYGGTIWFQLCQS